MSNSDAAKPSNLAAKPKRSTRLARQAASRAAFLRDVEEFVADARERRGISPQTARCYEIDLKQYVAWLCERGVPSARRIQTADVEAFAKHLHDWRPPRRAIIARRNIYTAISQPTAFDAPRRYAPRSITRKLMIAHAWHRFLGRTRGYPDPTQGLSPVPVPVIEAPRGLTSRHLAALLDGSDNGSAPEKRDRALLHLLCNGLTGGEICALRLRDLVALEDDAGTQLRCRNLRRARPIARRARSKRRPSTRCVSLDAASVAALKDYLEMRAELFETGVLEAAPSHSPVAAAGRSFAGRSHRFRTTLLFIGVGGRGLTLQDVRVVVRDMARRADLPMGITPRALRRAYIVRALQDGCDLRSLQSHLGHAQLATVHSQNHAEPLRLQDAYRRAHPRA